MTQFLWTQHGGRLHYQSAHGNSEINWLFLPGGPGLGSEALAGLTGALRGKIPGVIWHFDLPSDGSNILKDTPVSNWRSALFQAARAFGKVILVAHSTPGMYVQTMPELEDILHGLVLIASAPDASWQKIFGEYYKNNSDSVTKMAEKKYIENSNDINLRELLIATAKNCFVTEKSLAAGKEMFSKIPVNHSANESSSQIFDSENYIATWVPQTVNTLILSGSEDHITPLSLFRDNKLYDRKNILIKEISGAGHYPWFERPDETVDAFKEFIEKF